jgi:hypothetical protein
MDDAMILTHFSASRVEILGGHMKRKWSGEVRSSTSVRRRNVLGGHLQPSREETVPIPSKVHKGSM